VSPPRSGSVTHGRQPRRQRHAQRPALSLGGLVGQPVSREAHPSVRLPSGRRIRALHSRCTPAATASAAPVVRSGALKSRNGDYYSYGNLVVTAVAGQPRTNVYYVHLLDAKSAPATPSAHRLPSE
jgi:hypothetical protein